MIKQIPLIFYWVLLTQACNSQIPFDYPISYDLSKPNQTLRLEEKLNELSGIAYDPVSESIKGITDELGILYSLNPATGQIIQEDTFHKAGDYEDLSLVDTSIFILKSSGTLYHFENTQSINSGNFTKYNTPLNAFNDVEGLGLDATNNRLLLACKGSPKLDQESIEEVDYRAIYSFNLELQQLDVDHPIYLRKEVFYAFIKDHPELPKAHKLSKRFEPQTKGFTFEPSAIAIQPSTGNMYIISSVGKLLVVLDSSLNVLTMVKLDKDNFIQPEGICFDKAENLYICNESKDQQAIIYKFDRIKS